MRNISFMFARLTFRCIFTLMPLSIKVFTCFRKDLQTFSTLSFTLTAVDPHNAKGSTPSSPAAPLTRCSQSESISGIFVKVGFRRWKNLKAFSTPSLTVQTLSCVSRRVFKPSTNLACIFQSIQGTWVFVKVVSGGWQPFQAFIALLFKSSCLLSNRLTMLYTLLQRGVLGYNLTHGMAPFAVHIVTALDVPASQGQTLVLPHHYTTNQPTKPYGGLHGQS
jgi:hypothetical protein